MSASDRLALQDDPNHPLHHFFKRLPPLGSVSALPRTEFMPLITSSDKLLTAVEGLSADIKLMHKDLSGIWTAINGLHEQQKVVATRGEAEEDVQGAVNTAVDQINEQINDSVSSLRKEMWEVFTRRDKPELDSVGRSSALMTDLKSLSEQMQEVITRLAKLSKDHEHVAAAEERSSGPSTSTTADFLHCSSGGATAAINTPPLPPAQQDRRQLHKKRRLTLRDDVVDVPPLPRPIHTVSDLELPIFETQTLGHGRLPTLGFSRRPSATTAKVSNPANKKRYLSPGLDDDE